MEINLSQPEKKTPLYKNTELKIDKGITILIGPNGCGKTYCLHQIKEKYKNAYLINMVKETENNLFNFDYDRKSLPRWIMASEGQRIYDNLEELSLNIGRYVRYCFENHEKMILLLDGIDSGVSPDLIKQINDFMKLIKQDTEKNLQECYIIVQKIIEIIINGLNYI